MDGRIDVAEVPLIRGQLSVGMHVPLAQEQHKLFFGEAGIEKRERNHMKRQVPGRIPRILPVVRHGNHVIVVQVSPIMVAPMQSLLRRWRTRRIAIQPVAHIVMIKLF